MDRGCMEEILEIPNKQAMTEHIRKRAEELAREEARKLVGG